MTSYFRSLAFGIHGYSQYTKDGFAKNIKDEDADDDESKDCLKRDLTNISVLITGANGGIGFATAVALARRNATVHLLCRSMQRGEKAVKEILDAVARERGGGGGGRPMPQCNLHLHVCDVGSNVEVRAFVEEFTRSGHQLHVLVNNAATLSTSEAIERSVDGYETSFAVNTLGTHLLTSSLRPVLGRTSESQRNSSVSGRNGGYFGSMSTNGGGGDGGSPGPILLDGESGKLNALTYVPRVITVSSAGMLAEELVIDDLEYTKPKKYSGVSQYARDKRRQVALTERWARLEAEKKLPGSWSPEKEVAKSKKDTRKEVNNDNRSNSSSKKGDAVKRVPGYRVRFHAPGLGGHARLAFLVTWILQLHERQTSNTGTRRGYDRVFDLPRSRETGTWCVLLRPKTNRETHQDGIHAILGKRRGKIGEEVGRHGVRSERARQLSQRKKFSSNARRR